MSDTQQIGPITLTLRTDETKQQVLDAIFQATQEVFELDIKPAAADASPKKTGTNARSIDADVTQQPDGVHAELYTQSGYGGYLELGTRHMSPKPYLNPAFEEGIASLPEKVKEKLDEGN